MQVANAELGPWDMNREIYSTTTAQVLDIAVATMFGSTRN